MKKEINELLNSAHATLKVNRYCTLLRRTKSILCGDVDTLEVYFNLRSVHSYNKDIIARDWQGVIEEVKAAQTEAFRLEAEALNKELSNGMLFGRLDDFWRESDEECYQRIAVKKEV